MNKNPDIRLGLIFRGTVLGIGWESENPRRITKFLDDSDCIAELHSEVIIAELGCFSSPVIYISCDATTTLQMFL